MSDQIFNGPADFEMALMVINDETGVTGSVTVGLGAFEFPNPESVAARIKKFEDEECVSALDGFRLMTKDEAVTRFMLQNTGERYAIPGSKEWDSIK